MGSWPKEVATQQELSISAQSNEALSQQGGLSALRSQCKMGKGNLDSPVYHRFSLGGWGMHQYALALIQNGTGSSKQFFLGVCVVCVCVCPWPSCTCGYLHRCLEHSGSRFKPHRQGLRAELLGPQVILPGQPRKRHSRQAAAEDSAS